MPHLAKKTLSQYIRTGCKRQLRLNLSPDTREHRAERLAQDMPPKQPPRPGLEHFTQAGEEWQRQKLHDLVDTFGEASIVGDVRRDDEGRCVFGRRTDLEQALSQAAPHQFIVEGVCTVGAAFQGAMGIESYGSDFGLTFGELRPDLIQVLPSRSCSKVATPSGHLVDVTPDDDRLQLRVIDMKLTAEPSPSYFGEIAYYACALSGWLVDNAFDNRFAVIRDCAVWPGTHDASHVVRRFRELQETGATPTASDLLPALTEDLEVLPFEVFALRVRRFLEFDVPDVLRQPWTTLPWHVDNRCRGCDYLGHPWRNADGQQTDHPNHCIPMAREQDHISRVAFISRGAGLALQGEHVTAVAQLAALPPASATFDVHQALRATRTVVAGRARALQTNEATIPAEAGSSAVMPRWADLRIHVTIDFDISSAITLAIGLKAFWRDPDADASGQHPNSAHRPMVFVIDQRRPEAEQREVLAFLSELNTILADARQRNPRTTFQVYLWDSLQYEHFTRVIGRHLEAILRNGTISQLAWLFPPEEIMPNPDLSSWRSPITIVKDAVRALVAAPIPHYYGLFTTARQYHDASLPENIARFSVHPLFEDPLSDQIPSERAHEIWTHSTRPHWTEQIGILRETVTKGLSALETVARRLEVDLHGLLSSAAPTIQVGPPPRQTRICTDGQLWYAFAKLDEALQDVEVHRHRAMPPHEREAKFTSARLQERLRGTEEQAALATLALNPAPHRRVFTLRAGSVDAKLKVHDFTVALVPENQPLILDHTLNRVVGGTALDGQFGNDQWSRMERVLSVRIAGLDRERRIVAVDLDKAFIVGALEGAGLLALDHDVILDPTHKDFFTPKLSACLTSIGNPLIARAQTNVSRALGQPGRGARRTALTPVAEALWSAGTLGETEVQRDLTGLRDTLTQAHLTLNEVQWRAWENALRRRMRLLWGPPGTGKTRTLRNVALGALLGAVRSGQPLRLLVCASTYTALDNVLLRIFESSSALFEAHRVGFHRLRSQYRPEDVDIPPEIDRPMNRANPSPELRGLRVTLLAGQGVTVVAATPEQIQNLATLDHSEPVQSFFDLILVDEATQMDVAHAILPLCTMAPGCCVVMAGDRLQLPPIHQAEPPLGLQDMLGPAYTFFRNVQDVGEDMLEVNYRSADEIVSFCRDAGYGAQFTSWSPNLQLHLLSPLPDTPPAGWPTTIAFTPDLAGLLNPEHRCVCVVYDDGRSSQSNRFEADLVAALACLLSGRLSSQLLNERIGDTGSLLPASNVPYDPEAFWEKALGVVTPHRAQQALVTARLQEVFRARDVDPALIRDAVDTVERFQGQQRDVIIASFALGDPDQIAEEDEFLHSLNRFNVMASRARAKLIVLLSQQVVDHLAADLAVLNESRLLKAFVDSFCDVSRFARFDVIEGGAVRRVDALIRVHGR